MVIPKALLAPFIDKNWTPPQPRVVEPPPKVYAYYNPLQIFMKRPTPLDYFGPISTNW